MFFAFYDLLLLRFFWKSLYYLENNSEDNGNNNKYSEYISGYKMNIHILNLLKDNLNKFEAEENIRNNSKIQLQTLLHSLMHSDLSLFFIIFFKKLTAKALYLSQLPCKC